MKRLAIVAFWLFFLVNTTLAAVPSIERDALVALYNSTNGPGWEISTNWLNGDPCTDSWYGVTCDQTNRIIKVELIINNLVATIPSELGNLANLQVLDLYGNQLIGAIPSTLGNLTNLWFIDLGLNQLSGSIPVQLGNLNNLQELWLEENQLTGQIPFQLGNLTKLDTLDLYDNQLTGSIPSALGNLTNLTLLDLGQNLVSGSIPSALGNLSNLENLGLYSTQLSGSIPSALGNLTSLQAVWMFSNELSGSIPSALGNLTRLRSLVLQDNHLTGSIPPELGNLTNLRELYLGINELSGSIPPELGNLTNLQHLHLNSNKLSGPVPTTFTKLTQLVTTGDYYGLFLPWNALYATDTDLDAFLDYKSRFNWSSLQTVAPDMFRVSSTTVDSVTLAWSPIEYTADGGGYRVKYGTSPGGPYINGGITANKSSSSHTVTGLSSGQEYYFIVRTETKPHDYNNNTVISGNSDEVWVLDTATYSIGGNVSGLSGSGLVLQVNGSYDLPMSTNGNFTFDATFYDGIEYSATVKNQPSNPSQSCNITNGSGTLNGANVTNMSVVCSTNTFTVGGTVNDLVGSDLVLQNNARDDLTISTKGNFTFATAMDDGSSYAVTIKSQPSHAGEYCIVNNGSGKLSGADIANVQVVCETFQINPRLNDAWYDPLTDGQGFFITVFPDLGVVSLAWFTYDTELPSPDAEANLGDAGHRWLTALGSIDGNQAVMNITLTSGGIFDTPTEVQRTDPPGSDGTITLTFNGCNSGTIEYDIPSIDQSGLIPIQRVADDNVASCESLDGSALVEQVIFSEDFNSYSYDLEWSGGGVWSITGGTVDVIGDGTPYALTPLGNGLYIDLDGYGTPGTLATSKSFALVKGTTYKLSFSLAGNHGPNDGVPSSSTDTIEVSLGPGMASFVIPNDQEFKTYSISVVGDGGTYPITFLNSNDGDKQGALLDNVLLVDSDSLAINAGLNDAWYYKPTDGQGFFITVFPDLGYVSLAWFTYDTELPPENATANLGDPGHRWLTALGPIDGDQSVMNVTMTSGGIFDDPTEVDRTDPAGSDGTITLTFDSCASGSIEYDIPSINRKGIVPIERVANDNIVICETLSAGGDSSVLEIEPNDEKESATVFQLGNTVAGNLSGVTDIDWFAVDISSEQTGMVAVNFDVSSMESGSWSVDWYDPDMSIMSGRNLSAPEGLQYEFPAFTAGTYYLRVMINLDFLYSAGTYEVTLTEAP